MNRIQFNESHVLIQARLPKIEMSVYVSRTHLEYNGFHCDPQINLIP